MDLSSSAPHPSNGDLDDAIDEGVTPLVFPYTTREGVEAELDEGIQAWVVDRITKTYDRLDQGKSRHTRRWERTEKAVKGVVSQIQSERFAGLVPYGKQSLQTLISHFWGRSLQTEKMLFNVQGNDEKSKDNAPLQKKNLMRLFRKDRLPQKLDDSVYEGLMKGCIIGYVSYDQRKQDYGVPIEHREVIQADPIVSDNGFGMAEYEESTYDAASLKVVDPYDFVFDTDNHDNWDCCFKAYRRWVVYEDIEDNDNYSNYEDLFDLVTEQSTSSDSVNLLGRKKKDKLKTGVDAQGKIELIEFHGDFRLKDKTYLRNWTITIAARKKVVRFEKNPWYINPFVKWTYEKTPDGWGLSPIDYIIPLIDAGSLLLNTGVEAAKLSINPSYLAPKGMMPQKKQYLQEGMTIEYSPNNANPQVVPQQIKLDYQAPFPYVQLMEGQSEATTGATRQLSGNVTSNDNQQTATEFQGLQVVGNLILDRVVDLFNLDYKIPVIEKMAKITAMFNPAAVSVPIENEQGLEEFQDVTPEVYFGSYEYVIEDNKSELERKANLQQEIQFVQMVAQDPDIGPYLKKVDAAKEVFRDLGYGSPAQLFMTDSEYIQKTLKDIAIAQNIAMIGSQMPLGQAVMANGGKIDPNMIAQLALQVQAQALGVMPNGAQEGNPVAGQNPESQNAGGSPGSVDMAGQPGGPDVQGLPPVAV